MLAAFKPRPVHTVAAPALPAPPARDLAGMMNAVDRVMAVIEFNPDGTITSANANFSSATGYGLDEIQGRHHRMLAEPSYSAGEDYRRFWERLNRGEFVAGEFKRFAKGNRQIWLQASYNPIMDASGKVARVVKFATDITDQKNGNFGDDADGVRLGQGDRQGHWRDGGRHVVSGELHRAGAWQYAGAGEVA